MRFLGKLVYQGMAIGLLVSLLLACSTLKTLRPDGLKYVRLGDEMPGPDNRQWQAGPYVDTLLEEGGYQWPAKIIDYPGGNVWIEGDFFGADQVNRIRVESPSVVLKGQKDLAVGTAATVFRQKHSRWQVVYLPSYQRYDVTDPQQRHVHFLFVAPSEVPDRPAFQDLGDTATVQAIVVM
jgi:hypothetical protein